MLSDARSQDVAALVSMFTYQARGGEVSEHPKAVFAQDSVAAVTEIAGRMAEMERRSGLVETRPPDVGLIDSIYAWACGLELADIFDEDDLRAGDFVRSTRQLLDLLRQIRDGLAGYQKVAADAIKLLDRGIVEAAVLRLTGSVWSIPTPVRHSRTLRNLSLLQLHLDSKCPSLRRLRQWN